MNCQDIAHILDHADIRRSVPLQNAAVSAHLSACGECARDWELQKQLQALPDLCPSPGLAGRMRAVVANAAHGRPVRRVANGYLLGAAAIAVAAAAAMVLTGWDRTAPATSGGVAPASAAEDIAPAAMAVGPIARNVDSQRRPGALPASFRVGVLPLTNEGNDAAGQAAIESFYNAIIEGLRKRPDVTLLRIASRQAAEGQVDFLLDVSGYTTDKGLRGMLRATRLVADPLTVPIVGEFHASCETPGAGQTPQCFDGTGLADSMLGTLRSVLLPPAPAERQVLVARVGDATATPDQRITALRELALPRASAPGPSPQRLQRPADLVDPALLRGAIDLAAVASPAQRAEVWRMLRDVREPVLIDPLIQSARLDVDASVRIEAVATLGASFMDDRRVRGELDLVATQDSRSLVRALAQRALSGEPAWRRYVTAALKDDDLPAADRLEPLFHHLNDGSEGLGEMFDDAAIRGFAAALAGARGTPLAQRIRMVVFSRAAEVGSPAMTDLLLAAFREDSGFNRVMYLNQLIRRQRDVRIEALLREVAASDPDLQLRQIAARALAPDAPAASAAGQ